VSNLRVVLGGGVSNLRVVLGGPVSKLRVVHTKKYIKMEGGGPHFSTLRSHFSRPKTKLGGPLSHLRPLRSSVRTPNCIIEEGVWRRCGGSNRHLWRGYVATSIF